VIEEQLKQCKKDLIFWQGQHQIRVEGAKRLRKASQNASLAALLAVPFGEKRLKAAEKNVDEVDEAYEAEKAWRETAKFQVERLTEAVLLYERYIDEGLARGREEEQKKEEEKLIREKEIEDKLRRRRGMRRRLEL